MSQKNREQRDRYLGIDLGTTFSSVAYIDFPPSPDSEKPRFEPTNVPLTYSQESSNPHLIPTLVDYGPSIPEVGRRVSENEGFILAEFKLDLGLGGPPHQLPTGQLKKIEEAAIDVLKYLKRYAEDFLRPPIDRVCLAMPPTDHKNFQPEKTDLMSNLGKKAGFIAINVIEEPLAAILDVDFTTGGILTHEDKTIMVIDYGGGTCNVAIAEASYKKFLWSRPPKPLGLGTEKCGGKFIDDEIANWIKKHRSEIARYLNEKQLKEISQKLKEQMSRCLAGEDIAEPSTINGYDFELSKKTFVNLSTPIIEKMLLAVESALTQAQEEKQNTLTVDLIFLVGGGSQHPLVETIIRKYFANKETYGNPDIERAKFPQLSVSRGAALYDFYCSAGRLPMVDELRQELHLQFPDGSMKRLARQGQVVPFKHPNHFEVKLTDTSNEVKLVLWKKDPRQGTNQIYATPTLVFPEQIMDTKIRLDVTVDLRQHVIIKAFTRKRSKKQEKQLSAEAIVRSPLS